MINLFLCCISILLTQGVPAAQSSGQTARPIGAIIKMDATAHRITIKSDAGPEMTISFDESTRFLRVAPGAQDLQNAAPISLSDLAVGDRILARSQNAGESGSFKASSIIVMTKEDLSKKHTAELAEWETRGVGGVITALNPDSKEITISISSAAGAKPMVISFAPGAIVRRYAPSSVKFSDALPSRFEDLKVGDQEAVAQRTPTRINSFRYFIREITAVPDRGSRALYRKQLASIISRVRDNSVGSPARSAIDFREDIKCACAREGVVFDDDIYEELVG